VGWARTAQQDRHYQRVSSNQKNCSFDALKNLLEAYGYEDRRRGSGSSHHVFKRAGRNPITVPFNKPVKEHYVKDALAEIDALEAGW
jgi:predicted RNA binding protein YcfA (HicA-like mRNA interferase family)